MYSFTDKNSAYIYRKILAFCIFTLLFSIDLRANLDNYIEVKDFCTKYNYVLYIKFEEELLILSRANEDIKLVIGADVALSKDRVYFLEKPVISYKGNIYLPLSFAKELNSPATAIKEEKSTPSLKASSKARKINFIVIDPGHGGKDPGNVSGTFLEKQLNLRVAKELYSLLKKRFPKIKLYLTRGKDSFLSLEKRAGKAISLSGLNRNGIFISIHANASFNPKTKGIETFFYSSMKTNSTTAKLGKRFLHFDKLTSSLSKDTETAKALSLLYNLAISKESKVFAEYVNEALYKNLTPHTLNRGIKSHKSYFVVTHNPIPAILVEIGFLTNKKELANLKSKSYRKRVVDGLKKGIVSFVNAFNKTGGVF